MRQSDFLILKLITNINDKKLREKTLNLKTTNEIVTHNSYDGRQ